MEAEFAEHAGAALKIAKAQAQETVLEIAYCHFMYLAGLLSMLNTQHEWMDEQVNKRLSKS